MSNPLVAPSMPLSAAQSKLSEIPQAYFTPSELIALGRDAVTGKPLKKKGISIEEVETRLKGLDLVGHYSFYLEPGTCLDPALEARLTTGKIMATAQMGNISVRKRSGSGLMMCGAFLDEFQEWRGVTREDIMTRCEGVVYAQGGTRNTLGRIAEFYPKRGVKGLLPISNDEARLAIVRCGILLNSEVQDLRPRSWKGDGPRIMINPESENGFPVMSKWSDERTHEPILQRAESIRSALVSAYTQSGRDGVADWLRGMEASPETLSEVCLKGKCKADPYKKPKLIEDKMRFYNVFPRAILLNLQVSTQTLESFSQHITPSRPEYKSAIGLTLVRGGCGELVDALDKGLQDDGAAYTHVGDDSWVVLDMGSGKLALFSVDCSSFDLTQHSSVVREIHEAIYEQLAKIDGPSAALWFAYARERCVVTVNGMVYRWSHGGPSGFPLQSKVNDCIMDVYLRRVLGALGDMLKTTGVVDESSISQALVSEGKKMNLTARLEDFLTVRAESVREALQSSCFRYIGFLFYVEEDEVRVVADVVRQMAQLQYPNSFWVDKENFRGMEAVRLAGILISMGHPPRQWRKAFEKMRRLVVRLLQEQIRGDNKESMRYYPDSAFVRIAEEDTRSFEGLLRAVERDWGFLWSVGKELVATSEFLGLDEIIGDGPSRRALRPIKPPTHPATTSNLGRPPPNRRWGPPKSKTLVDRIVGLERQSGRSGRRRVVEDYESSAEDYEHLLDDLVEIEELYDEYGQEFDELQEEY